MAKVATLAKVVDIEYHPEFGCKHEFIHVKRKGLFREVIEVYCKKCGWRRR